MAEHLKQPKSLISTLFTVLILVGAAVVLSPFLLAILWAAIIATAFWPLHCRIRGRFPGKPNGAAFYLLKTQNPEDVSSMLIWCKQFKEYIGSADLKTQK